MTSRFRAHRRGPQATATAIGSVWSGLGVTPDVVAETADPGTWDRRDAAKVEWQRQQLRLFDEVTAGDKFCATQH